MQWGPRTKTALRHLLSICDLGRDGILSILDRAEELRTRPADPHRFAGRVLGLLFFQPSTRTRFGFHSAMARLGGTAIELHETKHQAGMTHPESLADTVRCISAYCDAIVLRHPSEGALEEAMAVSVVPVINGGSGVGHHPTQTLIDLFTIRDHRGHLNGLRIGLAGDLRNSRAARSLAAALIFFPPKALRLMAPTGRELPEGLVCALPAGSVETRGTLDPSGLDVLYMAGFREQHGCDSVPEDLRQCFRLTGARARSLAASALVLNPLPRIDEIDAEVDALPQAAYFEQSALGLEVRMAVLSDWVSGPASRPHAGAPHHVEKER